MRQFIDTFLEPALWFMADWSLRWAALLAVAALMLWIFRLRRASMRQLVLLVGLIAGMLVPFAPRWGGDWERVPQLREPSVLPSQSPSPSFPSFPGSAWERRSGSSASRPAKEPAAKQSFASVRSQAEPGNAGTTSSGGRQPPEISESLGSHRLIILGLASCWSITVAYQLIRSLGGWFFLRRLRRECVAATGATAELFAACRAELHLDNAVRLAIHPHVCSPILLGWLRPRILVPPDWPQRSIEAQRAGFLHELAHVRRRDHLLAPLLETVRIAFFFHPLVRWLLARLEHERELLCDEMVVRLGIDRRDYARLLLEFARSSGRLAWPAASLSMSRRRTVKGRIHHLLEEDMERWIRPLSVRWAVVLGGGLLTLSLGLASYRVWAEDKEKPEVPLQEGEQRTTTNKQQGTKEVHANKPAAAPIKREDLRYAGKDFYQWRRDLLTELKPSIRADGLRALGAFGANGYGPEAAKAILEILRSYDWDTLSDEDEKVVREGYMAIARIGAPALPALTQAVGGKNRTERLSGIWALREMRDRARSAVPVLLKAMKNDDVATRSSAMGAVEMIDSHANGYVPALIEALKDKDADMRRDTAATLRELSKVEDAKKAIPALLEALRDEDSVVRLNAIQALVLIGPHKRGVGVVIGLLQDKDDKDGSIRTKAYEFLQSLGPDAKEAVPALIAVLKAPQDGFTDVAVDTLAQIGPAAKDAVPELTKLLRSDNLHQNAMKALEKISPNDKR
jgi:beta-lactamase regulating signal transducer with metallopeptidase domain/HEAT repeat protein